MCCSSSPDGYITNEDTALLPSARHQAHSSPEQLGHSHTSTCHTVACLCSSTYPIGPELESPQTVSSGSSFMQELDKTPITQFSFLVSTPNHHLSTKAL